MANEPKPTILIIDDSTENVAVLSELLRPNYRVRAATSGETGLRAAATPPHPELILLDVMMPGMDGYGVLAQLRSDAATADIPVIFLTALTDTEHEERGLRLGAADFIAKPIRPAVVLARVRNQLDLKQARDWLNNRNDVLETELSRRMAENDQIQWASIRALAHLAETRDPETGNHLSRTQGYVRKLATALRRHPRFAATLTERYCDQLARSAPLHDIGKVGIPDHILLKPGKLTPEEWVVMQTHAKMGADAIEKAERDISVPLEFLSLGKEIARWHHEKWDGSGYPDRLCGEDIPVSARLMAVADVFDALIAVRPYKAALSFEEARDTIAAERGRHFDPDVAQALVDHIDDFAAVARRYRDGEGLPATLGEVGDSA
jgi:putative two-component system response regulator